MYIEHTLYFSIWRNLYKNTFIYTVSYNVAIYYIIIKHLAVKKHLAAIFIS